VRVRLRPVCGIARATARLCDSTVEGTLPDSAGDWENHATYLTTDTCRDIFGHSVMFYLLYCRDSAVGIMAAYWQNDRGVGVRVPVESRISSRPALRSTQPPIQWVPGTLTPAVKRSERESDHSPPINAEVKKTWVYPLPLKPSWSSA
jgi:hypothetical protein